MKRENIRKEFFSQSLIPKASYRKLIHACILGFDTEYDSETSELVCWQLSYKGTKRLYTDKLDWQSLYNSISELVKSIDGAASRRKYRTFVLATYFSLAEAQHLDVFGIGVRIDEWGNGNYDFTKPFKEKQQTIRICDIQQWFRGLPLRDVAKTFGLTKLDYDVSNCSKEYLKDSKFIEYALNDADITEQILRKLRAIFADGFDVDILSSRTPANTAAIIFLLHYLKEKITQPHIKLRRLVLLCSWGGNNQCFVRGEKRANFYMYDAVSMYPNSCLALGKLPRDEDWKRAISLRRMLKPSAIGGVCKVRFSFPDTVKYPCLPVWCDKLRSLCFPLSGVSYCTLAEVRLAVKMRADVKLIRGYYYEDGVSYLQSFMTSMLARKIDAASKADKPSEAMFKLIMNAIIGKFAQKTIKTDINDIIRYAHKQGIPLDYMVTIKRFPKLSKRVSLGNIFYPEWNCLILGYARATLAEAFYKYDALVGTTDSFVTEKRLAREFMINKIPFKLKKQGNRLVAVRTRVYALYQDTELSYIAHHGIHNRKEAPSIISHWKKGSWIKYKARHIVKLRESILHHKKLGHAEDRDNMYFNLAWDNKRIEGKFYTTPLPSIPD